MGNKKVPTVNIHGKEYVTVATRVQLAHEELRDNFSILTEILSHSPVVIRAVVKTPKGEFSGVSSVSDNSMKQIEKSNPYEVAETSAVGRALGFAGYGSVDSIASADEVRKSPYQEPAAADPTTDEPPTRLICHVCGEPAAERHGEKNGKHWSGVFCSTGNRDHTQFGNASRRGFQTHQDSPESTETGELDNLAPVSENTSQEVKEAFQQAINAPEKPVIDANSLYADKSIGHLKLELSTLIKSHKINLDYGDLNTITREEAIALLEGVKN